MTENEKLLSLALITLIVAALVIVYIGCFVGVLEEESAKQDPPTETVNTETSVEAEAPIAQEITPAEEAEATYETADDRARDEWQIAWHFIDCIDTYLSWTGPSYEHLIDSGLRLRMIDQGIPAIVHPCTDAYKEAARVACCGRDIDDYLVTRPGSPLQGYGKEFALAGYYRGVNPYLLVALTAAESSFATDGSLCRTHHNAWGMKGPNKTGLYAYKGWMYWEDWPSAIDGAAYFVSVYWPGAQSAYDLRGYCAGNPPSWISTVEAVRGQLGGTPW